jgi:hypothetical protein
VVFSFGTGFVMRLDVRQRRRPRVSASQRHHWIAVERQRILRELAAASCDATLDRRVFTFLLDELAVDETFAGLVGEPTHISEREYGHAIVVALLLRHSWREDDLEHCAKRLGIVEQRSVKKTVIANSASLTESNQVAFSWVSANESWNSAVDQVLRTIAARIIATRQPAAREALRRLSEDVRLLAKPQIG